MQAKPSIHIDEEFRRWIPPLSAGERAGLEASLLRAGICLFPLIVWAGHGIILDGHNRFEICTRHGILYKVVEIELADRAAARAWICNHQRERRNLTPDGLSNMRGSAYLAAKLQPGRPANDSAEHAQPHQPEAQARDDRSASKRCQENGVTGEKGCHRDTLSGKTARRLALEFGVSPRTILRDARYTAAVDAVTANCGDDVRELALSWDAPLKRKDIFALVLLPAEEQRNVLDLVRKHGRSALGVSEAEQETITVPLEYRGMAQKLLSALGPAGLTAAIKVMRRVLAEHPRTQGNQHAQPNQHRQSRQSRQRLRHDPAGPGGCTRPG